MWAHKSSRNQSKQKKAHSGLAGQAAVAGETKDSDGRQLRDRMCFCACPSVWGAEQKGVANDGVKRGTV